MKALRIKPRPSTAAPTVTATPSEWTEEEKARDRWAEAQEVCWLRSSWEGRVSR